MHPNPVLKKLGFSDNDRLVIIHTDDIGMCQASLTAFADLVDFGLISSAATMVPCPWFPEAARYFRLHPQVDVGVHLTLTSEWDSYRWGPISTRDPLSGLLDEEGYFHRQSEPVQEHANPDAVQKELEAQIRRALQAGVDVTHIDTHMGTVAHPLFVPGYVQLALKYRLPPMIARLDASGYEKIGMEAELAEYAAQMALTLEDQGLPLVDSMEMLPLDQPDNRIEQAKKALSELPVGLTHFVIHPAQDTPELRAIAPDWKSRVADYRAFTSPELRDFIRNSGIHIIGYRMVRNLMRGEIPEL